MINIKDESIKFFEAVDKANTFFLSSHIGVDCDNIGSLTALFAVLKNMGKNVYLLKSDYIPEVYHFLPHIDEVVEEEDLDFEADLYVSLDSGDLHRLGPNVERFNKAKYRVVIDHHDTNVGYGDLNIIHANIGSTCEILFELLNASDINITPGIATSLFSGISTDTGRFLYDNVTPRTFEIAGYLLGKGADRNTANYNLFMNRPKRKLEILKRGLVKAEFLLDGYLALTDISLDDLELADASIHDLDEIVEFLRDTEGVEVAAIIKQYDENIFKLSMRSKNEFNVGSLAKQLGGGGHVKAAGATFEGNKEDLREKIIEYVKSNRN